MRNSNPDGIVPAGRCTASGLLFALALVALLPPAQAIAAGASARSREVVASKFAAVNRHAPADVVAHYAPDADLTASDFCAPRHGKADVERIYRGLFALIPDLVADVKEIVADGDKVAVSFVVRGTIADRPIAIPIMNFFTVRRGLIVRDDGIFDTHGRPCTP